MPVLEQITRGTFIGEEFLTWLWFLSETRREPLVIPKIGECQIAMGQEIILSGDSTDAQMVVLRGEMPSASAEARAALASGKRVRRAKLYLTVDGVQWGMTIDGASLAVSGLRVPSPAGTDFDSHCTFRLEVVERLTRTVQWLFEQFLERRLDPMRWEKELPPIVKWAEGR